MFPIKDDLHPQKRPLINWVIIGINTAVFLTERLPTVVSQDFAVNFGLIPNRFWATVDLENLITSLFIHGNWLHFISNMWMLAIFGDLVEDRLGKTKYLFLYVFSGSAAGIIQASIYPHSTIPTIGASGAIAGVLGSYLLLAPRAKVLTLIPVGFFAPWLIHIPALFYLGFWFFIQLNAGITSFSSATQNAQGGIAWWAHISGFIFGAAFSLLLRPNPIVPIGEEPLEQDFLPPPSQPIPLTEEMTAQDWETEIDFNVDTANLELGYWDESLSFKDGDDSF